jgi:prepilin-type N-terminal cleavage/methylation domain-containing protein
MRDLSRLITNLRPAVRRAQIEGDGGFSLVEMVVGIVVFSIIASIAFTVINQTIPQGQAITDTVAGVQQSDRANESILEYLRGVTSFTNASASQLNASASVGYNSTTVPYGPDTVSLSALWCAGPIVAGACTGAVHGQDATFSVTVNGAVTSEYFARPIVVGGVTQPTFTYYKDNGAGGLTALTAPVPACAYPEIYAIGVDVAFEAGPQKPTEGFFADQPSTLVSTIYLRNPTGSATTTSSTSTTSTTACPE